MPTPAALPLAYTRQKAEWCRGRRIGSAIGTIVARRPANSKNITSDQQGFISEMFVSAA